MAATGKEAVLVDQAKIMYDDIVNKANAAYADLDERTKMQASQLSDIYARSNRLLWSGSQKTDVYTPMQLDVPAGTQFDYRQILVCTDSNVVIPCGVDDAGNVNGVATTIISGYELHLLSFWGSITKSGSGGHLSSTLSPNPSYMQFARLYTNMDGSGGAFLKSTYTITRIIGVA